jgi:hypothetical protein
MGAPSSGMKAADQPAAETLLSAFKTIDPAERRRHASVLNYWLSIRGDKEFPPLHDLDPLELSDAGPNSILLELISGGHDAEVRHLGEGLEGEERVERIIDAPNPSILACVAKKLPIVAISRDFLAFEDEFEGDAGPTRCWVTLLPLSAGGAWVDYVYALVSAETLKAKGAELKKAKKAPEPEPEPMAGRTGRGNARRPRRAGRLFRRRTARRRAGRVGGRQGCARVLQAARQHRRIDRLLWKPAGEGRTGDAGHAGVRRF